MKHYNAHIMLTDSQAIPWSFSPIQPCISPDDNPVPVEHNKSQITCCRNNLFPETIKTFHLVESGFNWKFRKEITIKYF